MSMRGRMDGDPLARIAEDDRKPRAGILERLLVAGGDARLQLDGATGLNRYGCAPSPRPQEISFSSSTASTISPAAYAAADRAFVELRSAAARRDPQGATAQLAGSIREQLKVLCGLGGETDVILSPSGTDAELQALFLARQWLRKPVTSIIVAADETGSGVSLAAAGRHFGASSAGGRTVVRGTAIGGLGQGASVVRIEARDRGGHARAIAAIDADVRRAVSAALAAGNGVVLHVMDHSKLGTRAPSAACIDDICAKTDRAVQIVVDACQTRLTMGQCRDYLARGFMVLATGSKFFAGPPLSGALFAPAHLRPSADGADMLAGLADYTTREDWPADWREVRARLGEQANVGQLLRWTAALEEMRAYLAAPELFRKLALKEFAATAARVVEKYDFARPLPAPTWSSEDGDDEFGSPTIFAVKMVRGRPLTLAESRLVYAALNWDLSPLPHLRGDERTLAAQICHVGQPVAIGDETAGEAGVIRVSASARLVSQSWSEGSDGAIERACAAISQLDTVFAKIALIIARVDDVREWFGAGQAVDFTKI